MHFLHVGPPILFLHNAPPPKGKFSCSTPGPTVKFFSTCVNELLLPYDQQQVSKCAATYHNTFHHNLPRVAKIGKLTELPQIMVRV